MYWDSYLVIWVVICLSGKSYAYSNLKCYPDYFNDELCPRPSTINVTSATFGLSDCKSNSGACCPKETDCKIPVTGLYLEDIKTGCNGRQQCDFSVRAGWTTATGCGVAGQTDYVTIYYDCPQTFCLGTFVNGELCASPLVINVIGASYGVSDCNSNTTKCCPKTDDCVIPMVEKDDYLQRIKTSCNGRQRCADLPVQWAPAEDCGDAQITDYVNIAYECEHYKTTVTPDHTTPDTGFIVGVTTGTNLIILLVALTMMAIFCRRRYQNSNTPEGSLESASSAAMAIPVCNSTNDGVINETYEHPDNHSFIMADGESYTPLDPKTKALDSNQEIQASTSKDDASNPSDSYLLPHTVEQRISYLTLVGAKEFLTRHPSAITDAYLEVPCPESENVTESGQPDDWGVSCHSYVEIDKPHLVACPMPPKTNIEHAYLETKINPVETRPSSSAENQYESIVDEALA